MDKIRNLLYQGDKNIITQPIIRRRKYNREYGPGEYFYNQRQMAARDIERFLKVENRNVNEYEFNISKLEGLNVKVFYEMDEEWLKFILDCKSGKPHDYDVVQGPAINPMTALWIQKYTQGKNDIEFTLRLLWRTPVYTQICFLTDKALESIRFTGSRKFIDETSGRS